MFITSVVSTSAVHGRSPAGASVRGVLQVRALQWAAVSFSKGSSQPTALRFPALAGGFFSTSTAWEAPCTGRAAVKWGVCACAFTLQ